MQKLVPVLDSLDMALTAAQTAGLDSGQSLQAGVNMVLQQLKNVLAEAGLEEGTPSANLSTRTSTKPCRSRKRRKYPKARWCTNIEKDTSCAIEFCGPPAWSWPKQPAG